MSAPWRLASTLLFASLAACSFDSSGLKTDSGTKLDAAVDAAVPDAAPIDAPAADAAACPEDLRLAIRVNGIDKTALTQPTKVLLGDTVRLDGTGSCSRVGAITYSWSISPPTTSALPSLTAAQISVIASDPTTYFVKLDIAAGGQTRSVEVGAFAATGFTPLVTPPGNSARADINGVSVGSGHLWIATEAGALAAPLATLAPPAAGWIDVIADGTFTGDTPASTRWRAVFSHPRSPRVYFGSADTGRDEILVIDTSNAAAPTRSVRHLTTQLGGNFETFAFDAKGPTGIWAATSRGITSSDDAGGSFSIGITPQADPSIHDIVEAIGTTAITYAGSDDLYDLTNNTFRSFATGDDKIRGLAFDAPRSILWLATESLGVLGVDRSNITAFPVLYDLKVGIADIPSDNVREVAVDGDGDVWMATAQGIARFKRDRATVIKFQAPAGVTDLNVQSVAIEQPTSTGGRPRVFFGTNNRGVLVLEVR